MKTNLYDLEGSVKGSVELPDGLFGVKVKASVLQRAVLAQDANSRQPLAHTKTKGEVRGGGRKPWKQKGTGRARAGSSRSPIWVGGGITFGPRKERDYTTKLNTKERRAALRMAFSTKAETLKVLETFGEAAAKTKAAAQLLKKLGATRSVLFLNAQAENAWVRAFRNVPRVTTLAADSANVRDVLAAHTLVLTQNGLETVTKRFSKS